MENCNHDCEACQSDCAQREQQPQSFLEKPHALSRIKKVIGVVSGKGGVGKSIVTSMLAVLSRRQGLKTAILDADVTGPSIPKAFGLTQRATANELGLFPVQTKTGIAVMSLNLLAANQTDPVIWRGPLIAGTVKQFWSDVVWGDVDVMFVDMPPGTGDVPLTVFQSIPLDGLVVVSTPQALVGVIVEKALHMAQMMHIPVLGLVENMSYVACPDCGKKIPVFGQSHLDALARQYEIGVTARLPVEPSLAAACDAGVIEAFEGDWLDALANHLFALPLRQKD